VADCKSDGETNSFASELYVTRMDFVLRGPRAAVNHILGSFVFRQRQRRSDRVPIRNLEKGSSLTASKVVGTRRGVWKNCAECSSGCVGDHILAQSLPFVLVAAVALCGQTTAAKLPHDADQDGNTCKCDHLLRLHFLSHGLRLARQ